MLWVLTFICMCVMAGTHARINSRVVHIGQGFVRGYRDPDAHIFSFLNVPYATAPTGKDKFKGPLPAPEWKNIFNAVNRGVTCPQIPPIPSQTEDCLVVDILVPANIRAINLPVMVNVHGGGYMYGSSTFFHYRHLAETQKLIVVTFNYRLGVHGFLCLGTPDAPGNAGMKDQVALLRWVNRNIASFGGNPNDVTITGCSAGGGSVDLLTLSPMTTGLFHKVVTTSGCSIGGLGVQVDPIGYAKTYAKGLNFSNVDDFYALEDFYRTASDDLLTSGVAHVLNNSVILFTPCVERDTGTGEEIFLSETPFNLLENGLYHDLPVLYGYAKMEGLLLIDYFDQVDVNLMMNDMDVNFSRYLPLDLRFESDEQKEEVAKVVKHLYFGDKGVTRDTVMGYVEYYSHIMFSYPMHKVLQLRRKARNDTVYFFEYAYTDSNTPFIPYTHVRGAGHCAPWIAVTDQDTTNATSQYVQMKAKMQGFLLNFIISGNPVPECSSQPKWPPVESAWSPYMALNEISEVSTLMMEERVMFWDDIYEKHYRQPVAPTPPPKQETAVAGAQAQESLVVQIDQGPVRGYKDADGDIYTFMNIPYATAPTGTDKFKGPLPAPVWTKIFDAIDRGVICPQIVAGLSQENCLIVDVYVPAKANATKLPVMVNIHGGGYLKGSSSIYHYRNMVRTQKMIVVSFNYRLGVDGFLCLGTPDAPGNAGMKDQVALLRWVNRNIASFGGNPCDVTIAGCSAGGGSVDLLTLSPMTTGLFHKVVTMSGCSVGYAGLQINPLEYAKTFARALNFSNADDVYALEEFYKTASNELLNSGVSHMFNHSYFVFTPCVERDTGTGEEMFLSDTPWNILKNGLYNYNLPQFYGYANMEGLFAIGLFDVVRDDMNANFSRYLPVDLQFESDEQKEEVAQTVKHLYFGDKGVTRETVMGYVDLFTHIMFVYPMLKVMDLRRKARNDTMYLIEYAYTDSNTPYVFYTQVRGAGHCSPWIGIIDLDMTNATAQYKQMKAKMQGFFINFIISGNPVPEFSSQTKWPPLESAWSPHMALKENSEVSTIMVDEKLLFWDDIYEKHYRQPLPPPR